MRTITPNRPPSPGLYAIKPAFVRSLEPVTRHLAARGISPTTVTVVAVPVELAAVAAILFGHSTPALLILVPVLVVAWMALNAIDGSLARSTGAATPRGAALNELVDRFGDLLLIGAAFIIAPPSVAGIVAVGILGSELASAIEWAITGRRVFAGPMGKPDRAATIGAGAVLALLWQPGLVVAFATIAAGSAVAMVVRVRHLVRSTAPGTQESAP
jgi:phosphatidylglycerophosphate synthase